MKTIGMIIPTTDNSFFSSLAHAVEKNMAAKGYQVLIADSGNDPEREKEYLKTFTEIAEGIIDVSGLSEVPEDILAENYPVVFVDRKPASDRKIVWVANDDAAAMKEATLYLIEKGCRNILLMPGYIAERQDNPRVIGYRSALAEAGLEFDPLYVLNRTGKGSSEQETQELVMKIMKEGKKVDAIITSSDRAAFGVTRALGKIGLYAPEDVRLIAFDNSPYSTMVSPSITAIDRNPEELSGKACEILLKLIAGEEAEETTIVPVSLIRRDSTR
ncbi:MAG: LacI family transcriptional regulator [Erysipelotrichaceae bacterium]|nr:LacI family transcriptional regulator [Erysipelotrichaceae bacterium]